MLQYQFDLEKFVAALAYLIKKCGPMTKLKIAKLLYLLDRRHFNLHGRPVLGDRYIRMDLGPAPSLSVNLLNELEEEGKFKISPKCEGKTISRFFKADATKKYPPISLREEPSYEVLSESEIEALDWLAAKYGDKEASALVDITHGHSTWRETEPMQEIDYRLFPKGDADAVQGIAELASIQQQEISELGKALSLGFFARGA
ncbi:MAG: Panacea domain-containing protein [Elusimicrobiota bacterium]